MLLLLFALCVCNSHAQNLLANGTFEDRNICIEYHSGCAPEAWFRVPLSAVTAGMGTAGFFRGNRYESLVMENVHRPFGSRSFIYSKLLCHLDSGRVYQFRSSFRTDDYAFDHVDVLMLPFEPNRNKQQLGVSKQKFTITSKQKILDHPDNWMEYLFEFTATGKEIYIAIGNFSKEVLPVKWDPRHDPNIIYDIDDISLLPSDSSIAACPEWKANKARLYLNNSRHTPNNFLDEEEEVKAIEPAAPPKDTPVAIPPKPAPVINDTLVIPDVLFRFNSSELNPQFAYRLDTLIGKIKTRSFKSIEVIGHTDSLGTHAFNLDLSARRSETVKSYLINRLKYAPGAIITKGMAATIPVATNKTADGRQKNRRVEIVLVK